MGEIIPRGENEQSGKQRQAGAETVLLRARRNRAATNGLGQIEQQMPTIQDGDRKQVDQAEIHRQHRDK